MDFKNLKTMGKEACIKMYIKVLFVRNLKQAKFPSIGNWMDTGWCYVAVHTNELDLYVLKRIMVSEMVSGRKDPYCMVPFNFLNHSRQQLTCTEYL